MMDAMIETCIRPFAAVVPGGHHVSCRVHSHDVTNAARSTDPWKIGRGCPRYIYRSPFLGCLLNQRVLTSTSTAMHAPHLKSTCQEGQASTPHAHREAHNLLNDILLLPLLLL